MCRLMIIMRMENWLNIYKTFSLLVRFPREKNKFVVLKESVKIYKK